MHEPTHLAIYERLGEFGGRITGLETNSANTWDAVSRIEGKVNALVASHAAGNPELAERVRKLEVKDGTRDGEDKASNESGSRLISWLALAVSLIGNIIMWLSNHAKHP